MDKYFLYARKSTDVEDKQVLSIEAQLVELRALARENNLEIAAEFVEKQSAKMPGRPIFNDMMLRIQRGDARGVVCWKLDRLARNPVDGGQISWFLQNGTIAHIQTHDRAYYSADNVLMMSVEFGMANQYVRDLSVNTARGLRQKARQGIYPGQAPLGYLNDPRTKTIVVDRKKSTIVRAAFELYAENKSRLEEVSRFLFENGIATKATKRWKNSGLRPLKKDQAKLILTNSFYYGHFRYAGEMYEGKHTPIIAKELFDRVQKVLALRGKVQKPTKQPQAFCGLLKCGECGCAITCEEKFKYQKNGNVHRYVYYRCTKKRGPCAGEYIREETLDTQLSELLSRFHLPRHWAEELERMATKDAADATQSAAASVQVMRAKIADLDGKIARLTDLFVEQDIEREEYLSRKRELMSTKKSAQENILRLERNSAVWLEPIRAWLKDASLLDEAAQSKDLPSKKSSLQKIFGSNLTLHAREARGVPENPWRSVAAATERQSETDLVSCLVPEEGLEPSSLSRHDFESCAYTIPPLRPRFQVYGVFAWKTNSITRDIIFRMAHNGYYGDSIFWVEIERIKPNPFQPRRTFDEAALASLAESIRQYGVLQPLTVTRKEIERPGEGIFVEYELIAGERRLRAAKLAGLVQVPVVIRSGEDDDRMKLELAIIENLQREDLSAIDRARAFQRLVTEFGLKHTEIGKRVGKSREYVSNTLRILSLPQDMQDALAAGEISEGHTRPLLMLIDRSEMQRTVFQEIITRRLTVRDAEQVARRIATERVRKSDLTPELLLLERELTEKLGTRVRIEKKDQGGKVLIDFFSVDDLAHIREIFSRQNEQGVPARADAENSKDKEDVPRFSPSGPAPALAEESPEGTAAIPIDTSPKKEEQEDDLYSIRNFTV